MSGVVTLPPGYSIESYQQVGCMECFYWRAFDGVMGEVMVTRRAAVRDAMEHFCRSTGDTPEGVAVGLAVVAERSRVGLLKLKEFSATMAKTSARVGSTDEFNSHSLNHG